MPAAWSTTPCSPRPGAGSTVKLLIDGFGSDAPPRFFADLAEAGGDYCVFNPSWGRRYLLRNHQKLITADDRAAIIGGANIDNSYLSDEDPGRWRDLWLRIEGPEVAVAGALFRFGCSAGRGGRNRRSSRCAG